MNEERKKMTNTSMVLGFLKGAVCWFVFAMVFACFSTVMEMIRPKIIQYTVDAVLGDDFSEVPAFVKNLLKSLGGSEYLRNNLWITAVVIIAVTFIAMATRCFYQISAVKGGEIFIKQMRDALFTHIEALPSLWHSTHQTGDIIQRCTSDVDEIKRFVSEHLTRLLSMVLTIIVVIAFMLKIDLVMGLIALAGVPLLVASSIWFHGKIHMGFKTCDENEGLLSAIAQENLTGVRVVRAFGREKAEKERFSLQNQVVTAAWVKLGVFMCTYFFATDFVTGFLVAMILIVGSVRCVNGLITVGGLLALITYMSMLLRPVRMMGRVLSEFSKTGVSLTRVREILECAPEEDKEGALWGSDAPMDRDIVFSNVSFAYPDKPELLHDVSFTIGQGTTLGILGNTGCGKSTLMQLLDRLYPLPEGSGSITIGGIDIRDMKTSWVRKNIGYVLQEPYLFSRTLEENIKITKPHAAKEEIKKVSRLASLLHVIEGFPKGFETFVGERGVTLSGGQKQRCAIARTLLSDAPILIFDDSLSAVDAETDAVIRENLKKFMGKATVILISHRITTLMAADQILVMEDGRITDRGSHEELSAREGLYKTILEIQQGGITEEEDV